MFVNINEKIKNEKNVRKFKGVYVQHNLLSAANYCRLLKSVSNER